MALKDRIVRLQKAVEPREFTNVFCCEKHMDRSLANPHVPILFVTAACPDRKRGSFDLKPDRLIVTGPSHQTKEIEHGARPANQAVRKQRPPQGVIDPSSMP